MSATVSIKEVNGSGAGTPTTVTNSKFCTKDMYNPAATFTLLKPATGNNYSYKKTLFLNADTSPSSIINNLKFFCDGAIGWTGVIIKVKPADSYTQATGTEDSSGDALSGATDITTYTSVSPLSLTGSISNPSTGKISQYLEIQAILSDASGAGALAPETVTIRYDEI